MIHDHEHFSWFHILCAALLLSLFLSRFLPSQVKQTNCNSTLPDGESLRLSGLSCGGCVSKLSTALEDAGVDYRELTKEELKVDRAQLEAAKAVVQSCGFKAELLSHDSCCH